MLDPLYNAIGWLLAFFYDNVAANLGIAIILLTITVMLILFPLTAKSARSMLAMQEIQPELKRLQAKYKGDRAKLVEEQQKLFQEHKVNPLGGCLPLVLQFPVFISLFSVLRSPYKNIPTDSELFRAFCGELGEAACGNTPGFPRHLEFLGMDLTVTATNASGGVLDVAPYFLLVALVTLVGVFQGMQTRRTQPKSGANPQMMMIGRVLPVAFGVFSLFFPAGLVLYFLVSNVWRLGQQEIIFRRIHLPHRAQVEAKKRGSDKGSPPDIDATSRDAKGTKAQPQPKSPAQADAVDAVGDEAAEEVVPARAGKPTASGRGGRLREMLGLPAADGEPAPAPARPAKPASAAQSGGARKGTAEGGSRSGGTRSSQGRRRNKKRKR